MNGCFAGPVHMIINASNDRCDFDETFNVLEQTTIVKSISSVQTKYDMMIMFDIELIQNSIQSYEQQEGEEW